MPPADVGGQVFDRSIGQTVPAQVDAAKVAPGPLGEDTQVLVG